MEERSQSPTVSNVNTTTPSWTMSLVDACMYIVLSLSIKIHNLYTLNLPSVHLQCREGASSKNVFTNNVMAAITKHKL